MTSSGLHLSLGLGILLPTDTEGSPPWCVRAPEFSKPGTVRADADQFPDLHVLVAAMERDWLTVAWPLPPPECSPAGAASQA